MVNIIVLRIDFEGREYITFFQLLFQLENISHNLYCRLSSKYPKLIWYNVFYSKVQSFTMKIIFFIKYILKLIYFNFHDEVISLRSRTTISL